MKKAIVSGAISGALFPFFLLILFFILGSLGLGNSLYGFLIFLDGVPSLLDQSLNSPGIFYYSRFVDGVETFGPTVWGWVVIFAFYIVVGILISLILKKFNTMKNSRRGFVPFLIIIVIGALAIAGNLFYYSKTNQELLDLSANKQADSINAHLETIHQATTTQNKASTSITTSTKKVNPNTNISTSTNTNKDTTWRCGYTSSPLLFDPANPPPTVCGYPPICPKGLHVIVGQTQETWPDGSIKARYTCSDTDPPGIAR